MFYDNESCGVIFDAEELCSLAHKCGDIDTRHPSYSDLKGHVSSETFAKIYKNAGYCIHDLELSLTRKLDNIYYTVNCIVDTVITFNGSPRIDIVRNVRKYDFYMPLKSVWLSLLKCVAYFYAVKNNISFISARFYYVYDDKNKENIKYFDYSFDISELEKDFLSLINKVAWRIKFTSEHANVSLASAANCVFPYETLREGQEMMIRECYSAIKQNKRLFLLAPTGTGKTVASLYPSVRAVGNGYAEKIFYLTSKASTRREAFNGSAKLFDAGVKLRTVVIGAKEQVCLCATRGFSRNGATPCNPVNCPYAARYYDKVEGALCELISKRHGYTIGYILEIAKKYTVCPYELSLDLSELCDIIICDYNYVFDPTVYFRRYFSGDNQNNSKYVFLVDEAHNLADRARDMYSATLSNTPFEKIYSKIEPTEKDLNEAFEKIILVIRHMRKLCRDNSFKDANGNVKGFYISNSIYETLGVELELFKIKCDIWLKDNSDHALWNDIYNLLSDVKKYLCISTYFSDSFYNYIFIDGDETTIKIFCLDPAAILDRIQKRAISSVMFSATLTPIDYFMHILGGDKESEKLSLPSPFDPSNLCVCTTSYMSTRLEERSTSVSKYISVIAATVSCKAGNYIAYFPSYSCLENVYRAFIKKYPNVSTIVQTKGMSLNKKEEFLNFFKDDKNVLRIGFCVLGGSFSEGVDLPGGRLIGTIIFGVGLPGISNERNIMRDYYDTRIEAGYDYAYTFPGMNNILQAAGRVIRREDDKGVVVLADDRYCTDKYRMLFPDHWSDIKTANNARELAQIIQKFWK